MLCVVPLLRALRHKFPRAWIELLASPINYDVMRNCRYVNSVVNLDKRDFLGKGFKGWRKFWEFVRRMKDQRFDLAIVPSTVSSSFTSNLLAYLSGARVRIGPASLDGVENPSAFFFTNPVHLDWRGLPERHQTLRNLDVVRELQLPDASLQLEITLNKYEKESANVLLNSRLANHQFNVFYHPGAGKMPNQWDAARFAEVANRLSAKLAASVTITSGPMDEAPVRQMTEHLNVSYSVIEGSPIREVAAALSTANLVITNDTGIMHVAAAVGVPVLSLFGPTEPAQWAPPGKKHRFIKGSGGDINAISVDEVVRNATEMLVGRNVEA